MIITATFIITIGLGVVYVALFGFPPPIKRQPRLATGAAVLCGVAVFSYYALDSPAFIPAATAPPLTPGQSALTSAQRIPTPTVAQLMNECVVAGMREYNSFWPSIEDYDRYLQTSNRLQFEREKARVEAIRSNVEAQCRWEIEQQTIRDAARERGR